MTTRKRPTAADAVQRVAELEAHILHLGRKMEKGFRCIHAALEQQTVDINKHTDAKLSTFLSQQRAQERRVRALEEREHDRDVNGHAPAIPGNGAQA